MADTKKTSPPLPSTDGIIIGRLYTLLTYSEEWKPTIEHVDIMTGASKLRIVRKDGHVIMCDVDGSCVTIDNYYFRFKKNNIDTCVLALKRAEKYAANVERIQNPREPSQRSRRGFFNKTRTDPILNGGIERNTVAEALIMIVDHLLNAFQPRFRVHAEG
jgi:hypothetical protein